MFNTGKNQNLIYRKSKPFVPKSQYSVSFQAVRTKQSVQFGSSRDSGLRRGGTQKVL